MDLGGSDVKKRGIYVKVEILGIEHVVKQLTRELEAINNVFVRHWLRTMVDLSKRLPQSQQSLTLGNIQTLLYVYQKEPPNFFAWSWEVCFLCLGTWRKVLIYEKSLRDYERPSSLSEKMFLLMFFLFIMILMSIIGF